MTSTEIINAFNETHFKERYYIAIMHLYLTSTISQKTFTDFTMHVKKEYGVDFASQLWEKANLIDDIIDALVCKGVI